MIGRPKPKPRRRDGSCKTRLRFLPDGVATIRLFVHDMCRISDPRLREPIARRAASRSPTPASVHLKFDTRFRRRLAEAF